MEIATSVVGLASGVLSVGGSIYTFVGKYRDVPEFVQQLQMDCRILSSIARRLHRFAQNSTSSADMEILQEVSKELLDTLRSVERMLPEGDVGNFRSRIGALWNDADFRAKNERIRDNRANIALLLNILQVNAASGPSNGSAGNLPETTRLHDYLHGGGKEPAKISRLSMRQVTHEPEFKKLKDRARNFLSRLRRFVRDRDAKTWELHEAVANCRGDAVLKLLEAGQDANALGPDGFSPLHRAIRIASYDAASRVVCTLVCFGATLSARDPFGDTPLSSALKLGRPLKWIMMLCEMDRDIRHGDAIPATSVRDAQGDTVLHAALRNGWIVEYVTVLLTYGASVDVPSVHPTLSPVGLAVHLNRPDLLRALLNFHAQMRIEEGLSPMQRACRNGYAEVVDVLCQHGASFDETPQPLCFAAAAGHTEVANRLLQYGCDPNGRDGDSSPLWIAVGNRHLDFARFLLNAKAEANTGDSQSPLFQSIVNKDVAMAKLLLDNGANVDVGFGEESPLYRAIDMGSQDLAVCLLQKRADINLGPQGGMPLLCAAGNNRPDLVDLMVRYGARNADFPVALFVAASSNAQDTLRQLLKLGASPRVVFGGPQTKETALGAAVSAGHVEAAEILIRGGADVNHVDKSHCDIIGYAIVHDMPEPRRVEMVETLLSHNAQLRNSGDRLCAPALIRAAGCGRNSIIRLLSSRTSVTESWDTTYFGCWTPLRMAVSTGRVSMVSLLCDLGCKLEVDKPGTSSLLCLTVAWPDMINHLVSKGFNVNHKDSCGATPLHQAAVANNPPFEGITALCAQHAWSSVAKNWTPMPYFTRGTVEEGGLRWRFFVKAFKGTASDVAAASGRPGARAAVQGQHLSALQSAGWYAAWATPAWARGTTAAVGVAVAGMGMLALNRPDVAMAAGRAVVAKIMKK